MDCIRVICASEDLVLRQTSVELCLTIPARLSSLLPHMNLLAPQSHSRLDSRSGGLVKPWVSSQYPTLGYRHYKL
jgi:hypothetical protein